jgi:hypothetical protein
MVGNGNRERLHRLTRRSWAGLALVSFVLTAAGLPLPQPPRKEFSTPFPCQNRPCGCRSAEECWHHCCCFTREEHLSWAQSLGIEPPPSVAHSKDGGWRVARHGHHVDESSELGDGSTRCQKCARCEAHASLSVENYTRDRETNSLCRACTAPKSVSTPLPETGIRWVTGISSLQCRRLNSLWVTTGAITAGPPPVIWRPDLRPTESVQEWPELVVPCLHIPPDPPPRGFTDV